MYTKGKSKICIICPKHGAFYQIAINHMKDQGCPKCGKYYVNGNFYMTVSELCKYENIKHTGDIKDYDQYLLYKK